MKCPKCNSTQTLKNGHRRERQCKKCKQCGSQFLEFYRSWRYSDDVKQLCIKMYLNGMGLRGIERVTEIHHTTVMHWIREAGHQLRVGNIRVKTCTVITSCGDGGIVPRARGRVQVFTGVRVLRMHLNLKRFLKSQTLMNYKRL